MRVKSQSSTSLERFRNLLVIQDGCELRAATAVQTAGSNHTLTFSVWYHGRKGHIRWPDNAFSKGVYWRWAVLRDDEGTACSTILTSGRSSLCIGRKKKLHAACNWHHISLGFLTNVVGPAPYLLASPFLTLLSSLPTLRARRTTSLIRTTVGSTNDGPFNY